MESDADTYLKYRDDLLRYATSLVGSGGAEDVVSTVVLRTISRRSLAGLENPHGYLMKGVLNESRSVWRRASTQPLLEHESRDLSHEVVETLDALWRLPVRQRAASFLFYWEDRSATESGLVAVGFQRPGAQPSDSEEAQGYTPAVWTSTDGITWTRVPHDESVFGEGEILSVTVGGPGLVAVGMVGSPYSPEYHADHAVVWVATP